jgi:hypothetical protein
MGSIRTRPTLTSTATCSARRSLIGSPATRYCGQAPRPARTASSLTSPAQVDCVPPRFAVGSPTEGGHAGMRQVSTSGDDRSCVARREERPKHADLRGFDRLQGLLQLAGEHAEELGLNEIAEDLKWMSADVRQRRLIESCEHEWRIIDAYEMCSRCGLCRRVNPSDDL